MEADITIFVEGGVVYDVRNNKVGKHITYDIVDGDVDLHDQSRDILTTKNIADLEKLQAEIRDTEDEELAKRMKKAQK